MFIRNKRMHRFSRRDFLKLSTLTSVGAVVSPWVRNFASPKLIERDSSTTNIIVILFDAMSARHLSLYGYPRETTPNFIRFAQRATVYHAHYSAGNFTTPGTTSLLTGLYPWTHRAINGHGLMSRTLTRQNIFWAMKPERKRLALTRNLWANYILSQFRSDIDIFLSPQSFSSVNGITGSWFHHDLLAGYRSFDDFLFDLQQSPASLLFGTIQRLYFSAQVEALQAEYSGQYPDGIPNVQAYPIYFRLEDAFDGVISVLNQLQSPTFAYFHFFAPHEPFCPTTEFSSMFFDDYLPPEKPLHPLSIAKSSQAELNSLRREYDEYIANVDNQFGRLLDTLEQSGLLDTSIVVVTADHGQLFERGEKYHYTPLMYDPVLRIPLMISVPGRQSKVEIFSPTNSIDVLPTLMHLSDQPIPDWCEGALLPGLGGQDDPARATFSIEAKANYASEPLHIATIVMRKGPYKLIHYMGYGQGFDDVYELYNLEDDREELNDLYASETVVASQMKTELLDALDKANSLTQS